MPHVLVKRRTCDVTCNHARCYSTWRAYILPGSLEQLVVEFFWSTRSRACYAASFFHRQYMLTWQGPSNCLHITWDYIITELTSLAVTCDMHYVSNNNLLNILTVMDDSASPINIRIHKIQILKHMISYAYN